VAGDSSSTLSADVVAGVGVVLGCSTGSFLGVITDPDGISVAFGETAGFHSLLFCVPLHAIKFFLSEPIVLEFDAFNVGFIITKLGLAGNFIFPITMVPPGRTLDAVGETIPFAEEEGDKLVVVMLEP
jgi:hypothetical protein